MPITITFPTPDKVVAPWSFVTLSSDFIGPLPSGSRFVVFFHTGVEPQPGQNVYLTQTIPTQATNVGFTVGQQETGQGLAIDNRISWRPSTPIKAFAVLEQPGGITIDSGTQTGEWQPTSNILSQPKQTTDGGLTEEQAVQLAETNASTFPTELVDNLTLVSLGGPGPGPFNAFLPDPIFGVIVRITSVPEDLVPNTPDGDYWYQSLAVVRVFRNVDLWLRVPVHTSSKIISFQADALIAGVATVFASIWILQLSVQVTFRDGVEGEVFLMRFPL